MEEEFIKYLNYKKVYTNHGPNAREIFVHLAEDEYTNGKTLHSVFYQIKSLYQSRIDQYTDVIDEDKENNEPELETSLLGPSINLESILNEMDLYEKADFVSNPLMKYAYEELRAICSKETSDTSDFLNGMHDPVAGMEKIYDICKQLPSEWTILQLYKGSNPLTTYSIFTKIHECDAPIYLTIIKHARSTDYPEPLCFCIKGDEQGNLFEKFGTIRERFRQSIKVDDKVRNNFEVKKQYWKSLDELNILMEESIVDLKCLMFPWDFLFTGIPYLAFVGTSKLKSLWSRVDKFCNKYKWTSTQARILLSLAALHVVHLRDIQINAIADYLIANELREQLQRENIRAFLQMEYHKQEQDMTKNKKLYEQHMPCILIVDERLDHFYWEELNPKQEFTRFSSFHCLWRLYNLHKQDIHQGYFKVHITNGSCLLNPDGNLSKMELRMNSFFDYWLPHWKKLVGIKPSTDDLFNVFLSRSCYVYAGHGSGLQYINGRKIAQQNLRCVVFLFGCDSLRLVSKGLYSELIGPHLYYQAAKCPALVGTVLPGLDSNMDTVATDILSRWIKPNSMEIVPWDSIDTRIWIKEGLIKPSQNVQNIDSAASPVSTTIPSYNMGSLCSVLTRVHQRMAEKNYTILYLMFVVVYPCGIVMLSRYHSIN